VKTGDNQHEQYTPNQPEFLGFEFALMAIKLVHNYFEHFRKNDVEQVHLEVTPQIQTPK
jgi:hypothetical protein